jgi:hypothetical protein
LASFAVAETIFVDVDATGSADGRTWNSAYTSLGAALDYASAGDEIWAAEGTYGPIELKNGVTVRGGFSGIETDASDADPEVHKTYIDGQGLSRCIVSVDDESSTEVWGFNIVNGAATEIAESGGGVYLWGSDVTFVNCVFAKNTAWFAGGAVANYWGGSPSFINCRFRANGGVDGRLMPSGAAGFFNHQTAGVVEFTNCLFDGNAARTGGAVIALRGGTRFTNCTFAHNQATHGKGGALFDSGGRSMLENCILWDNTAAHAGTNEIFSNAESIVSGSDVRGGWPGAGNIDVDPRFVDPATGDFRLRADSPCRDVGHNVDLPDRVANADLDLQPRVVGASIDLGALEQQGQ